MTRKVLGAACAIALSLFAGCGFRVRVIEPDAPVTVIRPGTLRLANKAVCDVPEIEVPFELALDFDTGRMDSLRLQSRKRWQAALDATRRFGAVPTTGAGESREAALRDAEAVVEMRARVAAAPGKPEFRMILSVSLLLIAGGLLNFVDLIYTEQNPPFALECTAALIGADGTSKKQWKTRVLVDVHGQTWFRFRSNDWLYECVDTAMQRAEAVLAAQVASAD